jgi:hypothetical protein
MGQTALFQLMINKAVKLLKEGIIRHVEDSGIIVGMGEIKTPGKNKCAPPSRYKKVTHLPNYNLEYKAST